MAKRTTATKIAEKVTRTAKNYRLLKGQPVTYTIKVGHNLNLLTFDPETEMNRAIRHCPNERSIFIDEQSSSARVVPIIFLNGLLSTGAKDVITQRFLEAHPRFGLDFELIDEGRKAQEQAEFEDLKLTIKAAIRDQEKQKDGPALLRVLVVAMAPDLRKQVAEMSPAELRLALYDLVDVNPRRFVDDKGEVNVFDDPELVRVATAHDAFINGVVEVSTSGKSIIWGDTKENICTLPPGRGHVEFFAKYLATEDGVLVLQEMSKR